MRLMESIVLETGTIHISLLADGYVPHLEAFSLDVFHNMIIATRLNLNYLKTN